RDLPPGRAAPDQPVRDRVRQSLQTAADRAAQNALARAGTGDLLFFPRGAAAAADPAAGFAAAVLPGAVDGDVQRPLARQLPATVLQHARAAGRRQFVLGVVLGCERNHDPGLPARLG